MSHFLSVENNGIWVQGESYNVSVDYFSQFGVGSEGLWGIPSTSISFAWADESNYPVITYIQALWTSNEATYISQSNVDYATHAPIAYLIYGSNKTFDVKYQDMLTTVVPGEQYSYNIPADFTAGNYKLVWVHTSWDGAHYVITEKETYSITIGATEPASGGSSWPDSRPESYDPDKYWGDSGGGTYDWLDGTVTAFGGGRYNKKTIAVTSKGNIFYG